MSVPDESENLVVQPRPTEVVTLFVPVETLESIRRVAARRDMPPEALMRLYVGQGLRQDLSRLFSNRIMEAAAEVLARHVPSEEARAAILREIRSRARV